jgi:hypothetical protein
LNGLRGIRTRAGLGVALLAVLLASLAWPALAHDTWFRLLEPSARGEPVLALGTGNRFPQHEVPVWPDHLRSSGCRSDGPSAAAPAPLRRHAQQDQALLLRAASPRPAGAALTCWMQLAPIDIGIEDPIVEIYLDEIGAPPALRARWAAMRARGLPWQETYTKHARIELDPLDGSTAAGSTAPIEGLGMDVRLEAQRRPLRAGDKVGFQVLRDGRPLAGLTVELQSEFDPPLHPIKPGPTSRWAETDREGRVSFTVSVPGRWLLRGTELRPSASQPGRWDSRFVTLAFDVRAAP